jgi:general secretion pathway protein F
MGRAAPVMTHEDLATGLRLLAQLVASQLSVGRVVQVFPELAPTAWRIPATAIGASVRAGKPLSTALTTHVNTFPTHLAAMIRAGEDGSGLANALSRAADAAERVSRQRREFVQALTYPAILIVASVTCVAILALVVLPRFAELLADLSQDLPVSAQLLMRAANVAPAVGLATLLGGAVLAVSGAFLRQKPDGRLWLDRHLLDLPIAGPIVRDAIAADLCATLSGLLTTRVSLPQSLRLCEAVSVNASVCNRIARARRDVIRGAALSHAFELNALLDAPLIRLVKTGEETGEVASALDQTAQLARARSVRSLQRIIALCEPTLILLVGTAVAFLAGILMQTIYSVRP